MAEPEVPSLVDQLDDITPTEINNFYREYKAQIDRNEIDVKCVKVALGVVVKHGFVWKAAMLCIIGEELKVTFQTKKKPTSEVYVLVDIDGEVARRVRKRSLRWLLLKSGSQAGCWLGHNLPEIVKGVASAAGQCENDEIIIEAYKFTSADEAYWHGSDELNKAVSILQKLQNTSFDIGMPSVTDFELKDCTVQIECMYVDNNGMIKVKNGSAFHYGQGWFITCSHVFPDSRDKLSSSTIYFKTDKLSPRPGRTCFYRNPAEHIHDDIAIFRASDDEMEMLPPAIRAMNFGTFESLIGKQTICYHCGGYQRMGPPPPFISIETVEGVNPLGTFSRTGYKTTNGSSGGPIFSDGQLVGVHARNLDGKAIAIGFPVILNFINDIRELVVLSIRGTETQVLDKLGELKIYLSVQELYIDKNV